MKRILIAAGLLLSTSALASESDLDQVFNYLKDNLMKKNLKTSKSGELDDGKLQYDFERVINYASLAKGESSFTYKQSWSIKQTTYPVVAGQRVEAEAKKVDRLGITTCKLTESSSTLKVLGICETTFNSTFDSTGSATSVTMAIEDENLVIKSKTVGYGDYFSAEGTTAGVSTATTTISKDENNKIVRTYVSRTYYVVPDTLEEIEGTERNSTIIDHEM